MLYRRTALLIAVEDPYTQAMHVASDENEFSNDREGQGEFLEARFPFIRDDILLVAQVDARSGKQRLLVQQVDPETGKVLRQTSIDCIHVAVCDATGDELDNEAQRRELEEASLHIRSSEYLTEIHLAPEEKFAAFKSWAAGIAEAGMDSFHIQEEIDAAARLQFPVTIPLMQFLAGVDIKFLLQYLEFVEQASHHAGARHEAFIMASLIPVLYALQSLDLDEPEYSAILDQVFALNPPLTLFLEDQSFGEYLNLPQALDLVFKKLAQLAARWQTITNQQREKALQPFLDVLVYLPKQSPQANEIAEKIFAIQPPLSAFFDDWGFYLEFLLYPAAMPIIERDLAELGIYPDLPIHEATRRFIKDIEGRQRYGSAWLFAPEYEVMAELDRLSGRKIFPIEDFEKDSDIGFLLKKGHIVQLNIHRLNLREIPDNIHQLAYLQSLSASYNHLTELPRYIGNLHLLEELHLNNNELACLPSTIGDLTSLKRLGLSNNLLESLPDECAKLNNLEELYLDHNHLRFIPVCLEKLKSLRILFLNHNNLTDFPENLATLFALECLDISNNQFSTLPDIFGSFSNLKYMHFQKNKLKVLPPSLKKFRP